MDIKINLDAVITDFYDEDDLDVAGLSISELAGWIIEKEGLMSLIVDGDLKVIKISKVGDENG